MEKSKPRVLVFLKSAKFFVFGGFFLQNDEIHFIVHISCTTEMSQTQNPLTP